MVRCAHYFEVKFRFRAKIQSPTPFYLLIHWYIAQFNRYIQQSKMNSTFSLHILLDLLLVLVLVV